MTQLQSGVSLREANRDLKKQEVKKVIHKLESLPPLPKVATKLLQIITESDPDINDIINLIETDQAITIKILKLVNSASFGIASRITSIKNAVVMLGFAEIRSLLAGITVAESIIKSLLKECSVEYESLWKHALATAVCAEAIVGKRYPDLKAEAFLGGLLHDVGKLILRDCFPKQFEEINDVQIEQNVSWFQAELSVLGVEHTTVGKWLAESWKLPEIYLQAIWMHHYPLKAINDLGVIKRKELLFAVQLSDILSHKIMFDMVHPFTEDSGFEELLDYFKIKPENLERLSTSLGKLYSERASILDINEDEISFYYHSLKRANQNFEKFSVENRSLRNVQKANSDLKILHDLQIELTRIEDAETILYTIMDVLSKRLKKREGTIYFLNEKEKKVLGVYWSPETTPHLFSATINEKNNVLFDRSIMFSRPLGSLLESCKNRFVGQCQSPPKEKLLQFCNPYFVIPLIINDLIAGEIGIIEDQDITNTPLPEETLQMYRCLGAIAENAFMRIKLIGELKETAESLSTAISKNNQMMISIKQSHQEFANLFEYSNDAIILHRTDGKIILVNQRASEIFGYGKNELINNGYFKKLFSEIGEKLNKTLWETEGTYYETQLPHKENKMLDVEVNSRISDSTSDMVQTFIRDVTTQKQTAKALSSEKEHLAVTLASIGDGVITTDTEGVIVLINKEAEKLTGWTQQEAAGKSISEVFHLINGKTLEGLENPIIKVIKTKKTAELSKDTILIDRHGKEKLIADSAAPIIDGTNKIIGVVLVFRDITDKQKMEEEVLKVQKFESIGILAGGIAHDFNNILTAISGNVALAKRYLKPDEKCFENLTKTEKACQRAMDLTAQLLAFSKGGTPVKKIASVAELIKDSVDFALRGSNVRCEYDLPDNLNTVKVDEGQINQVINNLIINADQAMPEGGIIRVTAKNVVVEEQNNFPLHAGEYVKITIQDQGIGISKDDITKIFDPYFTTKPHGNGLGLATAYSIIKKHEGYISVASELNIGTTVSMYLPASQKTCPVKTVTEEKPIAGKGKILLMDDEQEIRDMVGEMLKSIGYEISLAQNGLEAIALYQKEWETSKPFDAVIMDLTVPGGMGGKETIQKIRRINPQVKAIVSSGYSHDPVMTEPQRFGFCEVINKPFNIAELSKKIHKMLVITQ